MFVVLGGDFHIFRDCLHTVNILIRVCTVFLFPIKRILGLQELKLTVNAGIFSVNVINLA